MTVVAAIRDQRRRLPIVRVPEGAVILLQKA